MPDIITRSVEQILFDSLNYVYLNTTVTDGNVGSVIRTILEAAAIEDAEQYENASKILDAFFRKKASGVNLDERVAEYGIARRLPTPSTGFVLFLDTELRRAFLTQNLAVGATIIPVSDATVFPLTAGPGAFIVRLGENSGSEEDITIQGPPDTLNNRLTVDLVAHPAGIGFAHTAAGASIDEIDNRESLVCLVDGSADRVIPSGITLRSSPSSILRPIDALTASAGTQVNGNFASALIPVITTTNGIASAVPAKRLNRILSNPPYNGAAVINLDALSGGLNTEIDFDLNERTDDLIAGLSSGTVMAILSALIKAQDSSTLQTVQSASLQEDFETDTVLAYVSDGTPSFIASKTLATLDSLSVAVAAGSNSLPVANVSDFPEATIARPVFLLLNANNLAGNGTLETVQYESIDYSLNLLGTNTVTQDLHPGLTQIAVPEVISSSTEANRKYYFLDRRPVTDDELLLYLVTPGALTTAVTSILVENTDYLLNKALGQIEILTASIPAAGSRLLGVYNSFSGLLQEAQRQVDGDFNNPTNYPGARSAGVRVYVREAAKILIDVIVDVSFDSSIVDADTVKFVAEQLILSYINSLKVAAPVILAEIIERIMAVNGVTDVTVISPTSNVSVDYQSKAIANTILVNA